MTDSIVELDNVSVKFGNSIILEDVSMRVEKGDVVGIVGPNGGGKTTLLNAILGNIPVSHGTISLFGEDVHNFHAFERIGYVAQTAIQFDPIFPATVEEIVSLGCIRRSRLGRRLTKEDKKAVEDAIQLVGLEPYKKRKISQLSGGQKQRIFIAKALVKKPDLLVLDEATTGLDVCIQDKFVRMIRDLRKEMDITLLTVSHDLSGVLCQANKLAVVNRKVYYENVVEGEDPTTVLRQAYGPHFTFMFHHDHHECEVDHRIQIKGGLKVLDLSDVTWMLSQGFFQRALIGGICAAVLCSVLGVFIVLRRQSLIGEGVSHLAFGGIAAGLFFSIYPLYMALVFALFGTIAISLLQKRKIVYSETAIGILFSLGLALGAVLASMAGGFNVDLFGYLFGSILTVTEGDLIFVLVLAAVVLGFALVFYKELLHMTFDEPGARLAGVPVSHMDLVFNIVVALTVVISIKIVGSLLVSSLLIIPAASAMQLSRSFKGTMVGGVIFSIVAVIDGLLVSFFYDVAAGGAIVLISVVIFALSVLLKRSFYKGAVRTEVESCDD